MWLWGWLFSVYFSLPVRVSFNECSIHMKDVLKLSVHFEYLENRSPGLGVTWQPVRGRPYCTSMNTLPWSVGTETPLTDLGYRVDVTFTNFLPFKGNFTLGRSGLQGG
jgi:hypothetical protein